MKYTIKKCTRRNVTVADRRFIAYVAEKMKVKFQADYDYTNIAFWAFVEENLLLMCYRDEQPVGFLAASFYELFFDPQIKILQQNLLYATPNTRAANLLLKEFVDFGKRNANHVITMISPHTNIKGTSLERLGFSKLEELYRLEVK